MTNIEENCSIQGVDLENTKFEYATQKLAEK